MMQIEKRELNNGIVLEFHDGSNRYYGDYYRIWIEIRCLISLRQEYFAEAADPEKEFRRARRLFGETVPYVRNLEKMGVSGADLDRIRREMVDGFLRSSESYLARPDFPGRFIRREVARKQKIYPLFRP